MDLEKENSGLESVLDDEALAKYDNSESCDYILSKIGNKGTRKEAKDSNLDNLMQVMVTRSSDSGSPLMKGKGLKKWRRIKREGTKEGNSNVHSNKLLKRELSNMGVQVHPGKTTQFLPEMRQMSEASVSSSNEVLRNPGVSLDGFAMIDDSGLVVAPLFSAGAESENKEDSLSTTANVPNLRDGRPVIAGHVHDRNRVKSFTGKSSCGSVQKVQQGKTIERTSKKLRGQVNIGKQNSYSSMESDSRSSNVVLMQDNHYVAGRGIPNGGLTSYAGENGDQAHREGSDRFQTSYGSNNGRELEDISQREMSPGSSQGVEEENRVKQESSTDQDPLIESVHILQSVQEALEKEVQKFREIGNEDFLATEARSSEWTSIDTEVTDQSSSGEDGGRHSVCNLESKISTLKEKAYLTKIKLDKTTSLLKGKETDISELEARLGSRSMTEDMGSSSLRNHLDVGAELESIFRGKIEAEVKYLTISKTIQDLRAASLDKLSILEQRIASDKSQILNNLGYAESIDVKLRQGAEKLESYCKDDCRDETVKLQSNICKYTLYFLLQLIFLIVILLLLISQRSPHSTEVVVVPT